MKLISLHFPKSGGTSLRIQFERLLGSRLLLDYNHDPLGPNAGIADHELPLGHRMVHGHFRAGRYDEVRDAFRFTFLRNPVENLLSIYFFWQTYPEQGNPWHSKFLREKPAIAEFAKYGPLRRLMSETYFGGYDMSRFDFVGFHETRSTDIPKLGELIGLPLHALFEANRTVGGWERRTEFKNDQKKIKDLSDILADDLRFFEKQRAIWTKHQMPFLDQAVKHRRSN
jgi:hypothetical protein